MKALSVGARLLLLPLLLAACASDGTEGKDAVPTNPGSSPEANETGSSGDPASPSDPIVGLWAVSGTDARGAYEGEVEVRVDGDVYRFIRAVRYPSVKVEGGRALHWLFRGTLTKKGNHVELASSLRRLDFISERGALKRNAADTPLAVTGDLALSADKVTGTITATGISLNDTWHSKKPLPEKAIFTDERKVVDAHDPPSSSTKAASFALYTSYHSLDVVKPYVSRAEFQAAVHRHVIDPTDLDFYRADKNALRVVDKVIDDISLAETLVRADAYRYTLTEKAERFDADVESRFLDPAVGMIPEGGDVGTALGSWNASIDGSLWTGVYLASQAFRFEVTGSEKAKQNVIVALDALLTLQEITGDWSTFARTLRKARKTMPTGQWHRGTGAYANLEWLAGGNNDMIKGLLYGYLMGWQVLCEGGKTGNATLCERIRKNAKHLADDVKLSGSNAPASEISNDLPTTWLYAIVTDSFTDSLEYNAKAQGYWTVAKPILGETPVMQSQGIVDWSGQHLTSIGDMIGYFEATRMNLGGDALAEYRAHIDESHKNLERLRFPNWHLLKAAFGTGAGTSSPYIKDAVSRMVEAPYPKVSMAIDHRISPSFCMSPYPSLPWKNDWMSYPAADRTQGIDSYPLFELRPDVMYWRLGRTYRAEAGFESPGGDFLHLYWFARKYGLLSAAD